MGKKSPFPADFLGVDLYYDEGWQPVGDDLDQSGVRISHGARSESGRPDASSMTFTVTNHDGQYSPRNPNSPLYGMVGRNTPVRARVDLGDPWLDLEADGARATMPDLALDITGDIDIRWWGYRDRWNDAADLMAKWSATGNQRSWLLRAEPPAAGGGLTLFWTTNGSTVLEARSTVGLPAWAGEIAVRATLDVNNGSGGRTARFYYAPNLDGPWTQLGPDVVAAGTTSIFNGTAPVTLGREPTSSATNTPQRVYGWQLGAAIDGSAVRSSCTTASLAPGATSFVDNQGNTWTVTSGSVTNTHTLAVAEVAEWPVEWDTKGAPSVLTQVQANGVSRRLGQGAQAVESVLYRATSAISDAGVFGYWPMEDGRDATTLGAAIGSQPAVFGGNVTPAGYGDFPASAPLPTLGSSSIRAECDPYTHTGQIQVRWVQYTPPAGVDDDYSLIRLEFIGGTIARVDVRMRANGDTGVFAYNEENAELSGSTYVSGGSLEGVSAKLSLELNQDGSDVFWRRSILEVGQTIGATYGQTFDFPHTLGRLRRIRFNTGLRSFGGIAVGHLVAGNQITSLFDGVEGAILVGHRGESAADRSTRLASENGVTMTVRSRASAALGEQQEETLLDLLAESAAADGGILHDDPRRIGLRFRNLRSLYDQPAVVIPYQDNLVIPFIPTDDDGLTRNRVTITRPNGTRITHELTEGPMSIAEPPEGVGLYDENLTLNLHTDDLVERAAAWRMHVGTWDETRYPSLGVDLAHPYFLGNPGLVRRLLDLNIGDRLVITDPPPWLPPRSVDVLIMGVQYTVTPHSFQVRWTCVPARPYRAAYWNAGHRWSGSGTVTSGSLSTSATSFTVTPPADVSWTHEDGDYDIVIGGEVMTVTDVVGTTFTVTRSVNGVVKTHPAGSAVELAEPSFYGR
jgi:hypothetical protein